MRVLLISANTLVEPYPVYPLGLDYVAGSLGRHHDVRIMDMNDVGNLESLGKAIQDFVPQVIGLSLRNIDNTDTTDRKEFVDDYRAVVRVARQYSDAILVCGGGGFTIFPEEMLEILQADYGIVGEGERFSLLLEAIDKRKDATAIPGVVVRGGHYRVPVPWQQEPVRAFRTEDSHLRFYLKKGGMLNLQTKRGCPYGCIYCSYPHIEGKQLRLVSPGKVAETAKKLEDAGAKYFYVTDALFNSDLSHSIAVARAFKKIGLTIPWGAFFAPNRPSRDFFNILADAGLTHVEFGTEALSDKMLASYRKPFRRRHVFEAHAEAIQAGLHVAHYFLLGGPGETLATLDETFTHIELFEKAVFFFFCGIRIYPHTELYHMAVGEGRISSSQNLVKPVFYHTDAVDREDVIDELAKSRFALSVRILGAA
jgi:radical SAM superfamily enzyme YgiQ (UPF0313 family)